MPKVQVFLAWSGPRSKAVALALKEWLPRVLQNLQPWMSESNIDKGIAWHKELSTQLSTITTGIICLTPENLREPWINFEAGALAKLEGSHAMTYLLEGETADVPHPLGGLNGTKATKDDTKRLVETLNRKLGDEGLQQAELDDSFDMRWEKLEAGLAKAKTIQHTQEPTRGSEEMLKEVVDTLRMHSVDHAMIIKAMEKLIGIYPGSSSSGTPTSGTKTLFGDIFASSRADPRLHGTFSQNTPLPLQNDNPGKTEP